MSESAESLYLTRSSYKVVALGPIDLVVVLLVDIVIVVLALIVDATGFDSRDGVRGRCCP